MALIVLILLGMGISAYEKRKYGTFASPSTVFLWPMIIAIIVLKTVGKSIGFVQMTDKETYLIVLGILAFFGGEYFVRIAFHQKKGKIRIEAIKLNEPFVSKVFAYTIFVDIVVAIRYLMLFKQYGLTYYISTDGLNGIMSKGIVIHLILSVYPFIPLLLERAVTNKEWKRTIIILVFLAEIFLTFTKYHIIILVVAFVLYVISIRPKMLVPIGAFALIASVGVFSANYIINFNARGNTATVEYLTGHFINYLCGGMVYSSTGPVDISASSIEIMLCFCTPLLNMFLKPIFGIAIFPNVAVNVPMVHFATHERGNVMNFISFVYCKGDYTLGTLFIMIFSFFVCYVILIRKGNPMIRVYLLTFLFLSFFSSYFQLTLPWEVLLWCTIDNHFIKKQQINEEKSI